jgi:hypothetical protein
VKLNLGCGNDKKPGYLNVDFRGSPDLVCDLGKFPWPFADESADEILMLDFLEHFSWRKTEMIIGEAWRVLRPGGHVDIQVPDLKQLASVILDHEGEFNCNKCERPYFRAEQFEQPETCRTCGQTLVQTQIEAIRRLYGGQDYEGNSHLTAFTPEILKSMLVGFGDFEMLEEEHQRKNWNFKMRALKTGSPWGD